MDEFKNRCQNNDTEGFNFLFQDTNSEECSTRIETELNNNVDEDDHGDDNNPEKSCK